MKKKCKKNIAVFMSPPCSIHGKDLVTDSSWYRFISEIGSNGDQLSIVAPELQNSSSSFLIACKKANFNKVTHFYYETFKGFYVKLLFNLISQIKVYISIIKGSDYVIFRIPTPGFTLVAAISLILKKPLYVFVSGNIITQSDSYSKSVGLSRFIFWLILRLRIILHSIFLPKCDHVFCVSSDLLNLYKINLSENVEIFRTPVISLNDIIQNPKIYKNHNLNKPLKIIRACWLQESKGLENLIMAVYLLSDAHLIKVDIYGAAKVDGYAKSLSDLIDNLGLSEIITLKGWISNQDLIGIYSDYDLHVMSSNSEGMPRVCLEASAKCLPQLVTPVGGIPNFFTHLNDAYILEDCSTKSLEDGIKWFINNRNLANEIAINSMLNAKKCSIEVASIKINSLLNKV
jgi:glycosyltransferase involved in cell wall biosynthesis